MIAWLSSDVPIARGYGSMRVTPSSIPTVHNVQKQYGLRAQEIMVEIIRGSGVSKDSIWNANILQRVLQRARSIHPFLFQWHCKYYKNWEQ
jgi:hypothetical protein